MGYEPTSKNCPGGVGASDLVDRFLENTNSGLYKTKNIAFEQEIFRPTTSKHPTPPSASTKSKSRKPTLYI
jgi:hypothetical protein